MCSDSSWALFFISCQNCAERKEWKVLSFDLIKELTLYKSAPSFVDIIRGNVGANKCV